MAAVVAMVEEDAAADTCPPGRALAAAHIACHAALVLGGMWAYRRPMRESETRTFRLLAGLASRAGLSEDDAVSAMEAAMDELLGLARRDAKSGPWSERTWRPVVAGLEADAQAFAQTAAAELSAGIARQEEFDRDQSAVARRILDGELVGDELVAAAATVGLDAAEPYGVALVVHRTNATQRLDQAVDMIVEDVPGAVDLGFGDSLPIHWRVLLPVRSPGAWLSTREALAEAAHSCGVLVIAPTAAASLADLPDVHDATVDDLADIVANCGYDKGIIDPACVAPPLHRREAAQLELPAWPTAPAAA
ncbi:MAG TPA: hypothetical protein VN193_11350 [Candidatus Angelobacter sp.]|nr:hypothetical protein [Candidatus Angelobacter sp.]